MESRDAVLIRVLTSFWEDLRDFERFRIVVGILEILLWILGILVSDYRKRSPKRCKAFLLYIPKKRRIHATISATTIQKPTTIRQATFRKVCDYQSRLLRLFRRVDTNIPRLFRDYSATIPRLSPATIRQPFTTISQTVCDYFRQELRLSHDYSGQVLRLSRKLAAGGKPPG